MARRRALAAAIHPRFSALVWTAAASGLRFGELAGLQRKHLKLGDGRVRAEQSLFYVSGRGPTLGPPKTPSAHRTVTLPDRAVALLATHVETYVGNGPESLVFTSVQGRPLLNRYFAPHWARAKSSAGVDPALRFHDLRHLAGTTAASAGASLREVMERMGHATSDAALRYLKASERRDAEIAAAMERRLAAELAHGDFTSASWRHVVRTHQGSRLRFSSVEKQRNVGAVHRSSNHPPPPADAPTTTPPRGPDRKAVERSLRLLTIEELADQLGVSVRHVRRLVAERRIPYVKWGNLLRFDCDDVRRWIADKTVHPVTNGRRIRRVG